MRKTREILRLASETDLTNRQIARSLNVSPTTVAECIKRAREAGLVWPFDVYAPDMDEEQIEALLYPEEHTPAKPLPDMKIVHAELAKKGVTLALIWEEYARDNPDDHYSYVQFTRYYRRWADAQDIPMRQVHKAGEKLFIDFAGQTLPILDPETGEITEAQVFVAACGFSSYTYAEALASQELPNWISAHVRAFSFFGGTHEILVCDNLKSGVKKACRYEPDLNPTYADMAAHYSCAVIPARVKKPRDKAKAESAVQQVERWMIAPLRKRTFHSLFEANIAIHERLEWLNNRQMKGMGASRSELFGEFDLPALKPLPEKSFETATSKKARVNIDYHVALDGNFYSVSYRLIGKQVEARLTTGTVEIFHAGKRVASHARSYGKGRYITSKEHMPASHRAHLEWTPSRIISWAEETGPETAKLVEEIMRRKPHPEMGYRSCLGIIRLSGTYGPERMEAAAARALSVGTVSYRSVKSILSSGLDLVEEEDDDRPPVPLHQNVRGPDYYN